MNLIRSLVKSIFVTLLLFNISHADTTNAMNHYCSDKVSGRLKQQYTKAVKDWHDTAAGKGTESGCNGQANCNAGNVDASNAKSGPGSLLGFTALGIPSDWWSNNGSNPPQMQQAFQNTGYEITDCLKNILSGLDQGLNFTLPNLANLLNGLGSAVCSIISNVMSTAMNPLEELTGQLNNSTNFNGFNILGQNVGATNFGNFGMSEGENGISINGNNFDHEGFASQIFGDDNNEYKPVQYDHNNIYDNLLMGGNGSDLMNNVKGML